MRGGHYGQRRAHQRKSGARRHVRTVGEDVLSGESVLAAETRIGPGEIALLAALGIPSVSGVRAPRVALVSTGDELVSQGQEPGPAQIRDANRPLLARLLADCGAMVTDLGVWPDDPERLLWRLVDVAPEHA